MKNTFFKATALVLALLTAALAFTACTKDEGVENKISIAASSAPHAEILEQCKGILEAKGITLDIQVMDDYIMPNNATESGDVDANYFQHIPYLEQFNAENGTHLVLVSRVHYEPYGIYTGTKASLDALEDGDKVAVPNDATNEARALLLLEANGLITLKEDAGLTATKNDIVDNPKNLEIVELEAALIPGVRNEVAVAVINGNYAINSGISISEALATEDAQSEAAQTYANILVVREGNETNENILALAEALKSEEVKSFIETTYGGAVVPLF